MASDKQPPKPIDGKARESLETKNESEALVTKNRDRTAHLISERAFGLDLEKRRELDELVSFLLEASEEIKPTTLRLNSVMNRNAKRLRKLLNRDWDTNQMEGISAFYEKLFSKARVITKRIRQSAEENANPYVMDSAGRRGDAFIADLSDLFESIEKECETFLKPSPLTRAETERYRKLVLDMQAFVKKEFGDVTTREVTLGALVQDFVEFGFGNQKDLSQLLIKAKENYALFQGEVGNLHYGDIAEGLIGSIMADKAFAFVAAGEIEKAKYRIIKLILHIFNHQLTIARRGVTYIGERTINDEGGITYGIDADNKLNTTETTKRLILLFERFLTGLRAPIRTAALLKQD